VWTVVVVLAIGSEPFVKEIRMNLAGKAICRSTSTDEYAKTHILRESLAPYRADFDREITALSAKNSLEWLVYVDDSVT